MYYLYLTIFIIISYLIIDMNIKNKIKYNKTKNKIKNKEIEHFNTTGAPPLFPSPTFSYYDIPMPNIDDVKEYITTKMELIYLNPKYDTISLKEIETSSENYEEFDFNVNENSPAYNPSYVRPDIIEERNLAWKSNYFDNICKDGRCGCIEIENNEDIKEEICGYKKNNQIYECPMTCSKCHRCHRRINENIYDSKCDNANTVQLKQKCKLYEQRAKHMKDKCIYKFRIEDEIRENEENNKYIRSNKKNDCKMFFTQNNNNFYVNSDILIRINIDVKKNTFRPKIKKFIKEIKIDKFLFDDIDTDFNIFYQDKEEIYIFIVPKEVNRGKSKLIKVIGTILFKNNKEIEFEVRYVVNIYNFKEYNIEQNKFRRTSNVISETQSYLSDNYSSNYLNSDESSIGTCNLVKNNSIYNPVMDLEEGEFIREKLIDNPNTWSKRADIARPWIFTG